MGKNFIKWIAPMCLGLCLFGASGLNTQTPQNVVADQFYVSEEIKIQNSGVAVPIFDANLLKVLKVWFNKNQTQSINSDEFKVSDAFKNATMLDFSGTGVTSITELARFELPESISFINLAGNGITNNDLLELEKLVNSTVGDKLQFGAEEIVVKTDFKNQISKVNLNDNDIDLSQENLKNALENSQSTSYDKFIFGFQNLGSIDKSGLVDVNQDTINPMYFIRENIDENYLGFTLKYELSLSADSKIIPTYNKCMNFVDYDKLDKYTISVAGATGSEFKDYRYNKEFILFSVELEEGFFIEYKSLFDLKVSAQGKLLTGSPLIIKGFGNMDSLTIAYGNESTSIVTKIGDENCVDIKLKIGDSERIIPLNFVVKDTIEPVIRLKGGNKIYISKNKSFAMLDPWVIAYDPLVEGANEGEDVSDFVEVDYNNLDVTTLGEYQVIYTYKDEGGNIATAIRTVVVREKVLDNIILKITSSEDDKVSNGEDVVLFVSPETGVDMTPYSEVKYYWYMNNVLYQESKGDASGASTISIIADSSMEQNIYVKAIATLKSDGSKIELFSETLEINAEASIDDNETLIIALTIVLMLIIIGFGVFALIKYNKSKNKTHRKHKNVHKGKDKSSSKTKSSKGGSKNETKNKGVESEEKSEIQVIKDYKGESGTVDAKHLMDEGVTDNSKFVPKDKK